MGSITHSPKHKKLKNYPNRRPKAKESVNKKKKKTGHPVTKWTPIAREKLLQAMRKYINRHTIPILAEFAYKNHVSRTHLYDYKELADAIKMCHDKKEAGLERLMLSGKPHVSTGCIFSLKQLGWKDRQEIEHSGSISLTIDSDDAKV